MCCIVAKYFEGSGWTVVKNRDRNYIPNVEIIEEDGLRLMTDLTTYYQEGINAYGVGVISSSLMVLDDEKEYRRRMLSSGKKSRDGERIKAGLLAGDLESVKLELIKQRLTGHTFIFTPEELWILEGAKDSENKYNFTMRRVKRTEVLVRTNHGIDLTWAGYRTGFKVLSSLFRYNYGRCAGIDSVSTEDLIELMRRQWNDDWGLNICRKSDNPLGMKTVGQVVVSNGHLEHFVINQSSMVS